MSKKTKEDDPDYVIYQALKKLKEAQFTSMESPYKLKILINEAVEILEDYAEIKGSKTWNARNARKK